MLKNTTIAVKTTTYKRPKSMIALAAVGLAAAVTIGHGAINSADAQECPAKLQISSEMTRPCGAGGVDVVGLQQAAIYMWNTFIAINWPGAPFGRGKPDTTEPFGATDAHDDLLPVAWTTMRNKVDLYPGNGSATVPPHGVTLGTNGLPNNPPQYGYGNAPKYIYDASETGNSDGTISACSGQPPIANPAYVNLDETTQIGNNQLYAGIVPATDPTGRNSNPQLIRYTVKMNETFWARTIPNGFW